LLDYKKLGTKLVINGFSINPILDENSFMLSTKGIANYEDIHLCDYGRDPEETVEDYIKKGMMSHKNYLGKRIGNPKVNYINNKNTRGWTGYQLIENGYYIIKIWDNFYPARIQFDLYLDEKMDDADLIIDGLCAPAVPFDGFGMFDYSYSLSYITKPESILEKNDKTSSYHLNEPFNIEKYIEEKGGYEIILNQLDTIHCHFCTNDGKYFIFGLNKQSVITVCENHIESGSNKEFGADQKQEIDKRNVSWYGDKFLMKRFKDNNIIYTINEDMENNGKG
jgi:hypothetical protein